MSGDRAYQSFNAWPQIKAKPATPLFRTACALKVERAIKGAQLSGGENSHSLKIIVSRRQRIFTRCRPFLYFDFPFDR